MCACARARAVYKITWKILTLSLRESQRKAWKQSRAGRSEETAVLLFVLPFPTPNSFLYGGVVHIKNVPSLIILLPWWFELVKRIAWLARADFIFVIDFLAFCVPVSRDINEPLTDYGQENRKAVWVFPLHLEHTLDIGLRVLLPCV